MSICEVLEYPPVTGTTVPAVGTNKTTGWRLTRDDNPEDSGVYLVAIRHDGGKEDIRPAHYDAEFHRWGSANLEYLLGDVLAWMERPPFPDVPYLVDSFKDDATGTEWHIYSDGAVFKKSVGMRAPRRDKMAEADPTVRRILELLGVRPS